MNTNKQSLEFSTGNGMVFIIGSPRSGTSVLSHAIAQHPDFWTSSETDFMFPLFGNGRLENVFQEACSRPGHGWLLRHDVSYEEFAAYIGSGIIQLFRSRSIKRYWVDSTPSYTMMVDTLQLMFPRARFLHILRDGRAVVNSMINSGFPVAWAGDFRKACKKWVSHVSAAVAFCRDQPDRALELRVEDLEKDPEAFFREAFAFLQVEYAPAAVDFVLRGRINSSYGNVNEGDINQVKPTSVTPKEPWKDWSRKQRSIFSKIAGQAMVEMGYSTNS